MVRGGGTGEVDWGGRRGGGGGAVLPGDGNVGGLRGGGGGFPRDNFEGEPPVGESVLAGRAGTGRDSGDGFTGELVRAGTGGDGRDGGAGGLPE